MQNFIETKSRPLSFVSAVNANELDANNFQSILARQMNYAWEHHVVVPPVGECADVHTETDAYAIQHRWAQLRLRMSDAQVGYKTSQFARNHSNNGPSEAAECGWGRLWRSHYFPSFDGVARLPIHTSTHPRVEGKIICHIGKTLSGADLTATDVLAAVDGIAIGLEIIDCRIANGYGNRMDMIVDNLGFGGFTHGAWKRRPYTQLPLSSTLVRRLRVP